ncbi:MULTISPECIES: hypothetical protein [unclassified Sulfitobacter]|uniref:hypothetical protein n=1 Tax=unclassified Sulfitobacter TaxID=196795 RepID=UPI0037453328
MKPATQAIPRGQDTGTLQTAPGYTQTGQPAPVVPNAVDAMRLPAAEPYGSPANFPKAPPENPAPLWPECDKNRISLPKGVKLSIYNQYVEDGFSCTLMGPWFKFETFGHELVMSLDTEYQSQGRTNDIVSYQVLAVSSAGRAVELIFYCDDGKRLALSEIIETCRTLLGIKPASLSMPSKRSKTPAPVLVLSHFGTAEWAALRDRRKLGAILDNIRRVPISLNTVAFDVCMNNRNKTIGLKVADTTLLAPTGKGRLAALGEVVGVEKLELPDGAIKRMRAFSDEDPALFADYGVNDCRITYAYYARMYDLAINALHLERMPITLGGFGVAEYCGYIGEYDLLEFFGLEKVQEGRKTTTVRTTDRELTDGFFAPAFCGGLNVAIPAEVKNSLIVDLDFVSCYPSAAATLPVIDWTESDQDIDPNALTKLVTDTLDQYSSTPIALAYVDFQFPDTCRWPSIPIRNGSRGLIYPLRGTGFATSFELADAISKGAQIETRRVEYMQPVLNEREAPQLMFADYLALLIARRREHPKGSLENLMFKEMSNSFYGKLAQGVRSRNIRSFDNVKALPESKITSPAHAGAITGLVRSALTGLIDAIEECGGTVLAATTDGAMGSFPHLAHLPRPITLSDIPGFLDAALRKPAIRALAAGMQNMGIAGDPIEIKHVGDRAKVWKTRGYIIFDGDTPQHIARAGHRGSAEDLMKFDDEDDGDLRWTLSRLSSAQSIWDGKTNDLVNIFEARRVNLDFDFKRIPTANDNFRPPRDIAEFEDWRETMENIRKRGERATLSKVKTAQAGIKMQGGEKAAVKRQLLRAIVQNLSGVYPRDDEGKPVTQKKLAERLGVTVMDVKNAKHRTFTKLPHTDIALSVFAKTLGDLYPGVDTGDFADFERAVFSNT